MSQIPLHFRPWTIKNEELPATFVREQNCLRQSLIQEAGYGYTKIAALDHDLSYLETHYQPRRDFTILSHMDYQEPRIVVTLGLKGRSRFAGRCGDDVVFDDGYTTIVAFSSSQGERQYTAGEPITQLRFSLSKSWLDRYLGERADAGAVSQSGHRVLSHRPTSAQSMILAQQLLAGDVPEQMLPAFRHGQALLILASELVPLIAGSDNEYTRVDAREMALANAARAILFNEYQDPPTVLQLARRIGTNQIRLTQLFHRCFNNTPYGLLFEIRMQKAYELLESRRFPIDTVADLVGYKHASSFSAAFTRHFGISPKHIAKKG